MIGRKLLCVLGSLTAVQTVAAQRVTPGQPARVTLTDSSTRLGVLDSVTRGEVWFHSDLQPPAPIPSARIQRLELRQHRKPDVGKGIAYGALAGVVVGGALWLAFINSDEFEEEKGRWAAVFLGSGAAGGALAGAGLSLILARDRWTTVPRDQWALAPPAAWYLGLRFSP
jgi:hypothetical protein